MTRRDHTREGLVGSLLVLALPLLLQSSVQAIVFQLGELRLLARLGEEATTAVIVTNQSLRQVVMMTVMGASFGAAGLVARAMGGGRVAEAEHVAGQVVFLGLALGALLAVAGTAAGPALLARMQVAPEVLELGTPYVRLVFLLSFLFIFPILFGSLLSAAGDGATPVAISLLQAPISLVAEWCLIFGHLGLPRLGVSGVALGLAVGQAVALGLGLRVLFRGSSRVHLRLRHLRPDPEVLRRIAALAWPPALQMLGGFLVTVAFLRLAGGLGATAQAAYSIGLRLGMIGPQLAFPLAGACATLVGQALGSGSRRRAWRAFAVGLAAHAGVLWSVGGVFAVFREPIVAAFADDPEVIRIGGELLLYQAGIFGFWGIFFVVFRCLQAAGDVLVPMAASLGTSILVTLPLGHALAVGRGLGPTGLFVASLVGAGVVTAATALWFATGRWTRRAPRPLHGGAKGDPPG